MSKLQVPKKREIKDQEKEMLRQQVIRAEANADKIAMAYEELEVWSRKSRSSSNSKCSRSR